MRKMYLPGGSATPGTSTSELNVKNVRLSNGCAERIATVNELSSSTEYPELKILLRMSVPSQMCGLGFHSTTGRLTVAIRSWFPFRGVDRHRTYACRHFAAVRPRCCFESSSIQTQLRKGTR